jgi:hypothetical protein
VLVALLALAVVALLLARAAASDAVVDADLACKKGEERERRVRDNAAARNDVKREGRGG